MSGLSEQSSWTWFPTPSTLLASDKETASRVAKVYLDRPLQIFMLTHDSKLDSGITGASVGWTQPERRTQKINLDTNKKVLDTELYAIVKALVVVVGRGRTGRGRASWIADTRWTKIQDS